MKEGRIMLRLKSLFLVSLCLLFSSASCTGSDTPAGEGLDITSKKIVARIDAEPVYEGDVFRRMQAAYGTIDRKKMTPNQWQMMLEAATDSEIIDKMLFKTAVSEGIEAPQENIDSALGKTKEMMGEEKYREMLGELGATEEQYREFLRQREVISLYKNRLFQKIDITEQDMKSYYEGHKKDYDVPEGVRIEIFSVAEKEKADEIYGRWKKGESFEKLSNDYSEGNRDPLGRRLRWMPYDAMPKVLQPAVRDGNPGEVLAPVQDNERLYVVKIIEKRKEGIMGFDEAKDIISEDIRRTRENKILDDWFDTEKQKVKIEYVR